MLVSVRGIGAVCVSDQPGDEAILADQIVSDRSTRIVIFFYFLVSFGVAVLEPSMSFGASQVFFRDLWQRRGLRDVWASDAALCGAWCRDVCI
ncbi:hypothetical protein Bca4012_020290 [Brassica carinata]